MINNLKLGFKIIKYGHAAKLTYISSAVCLVIGILFCILTCAMGEMTEGSISPFPGGYFMTMVVLLYLQMLATVNATNLVLASPQKRKLQTSVPAVFSVTLMMAGYFVTVVTMGIICRFYPAAIDVVAEQIFASAVLSGIVMVYYGACFKYFFTSSIIFFITFFSYTFGVSRSSLLTSILSLDGSWATWALTVILGAAVILICGFLQYLISLAVYKAPVSKMALGARLRAEM